VADKKPLVVYAASYKSLSSTEADLDAIEQLHKDKVPGSCPGRSRRGKRPADQAGPSPRGYPGTAVMSRAGRDRVARLAAGTAPDAPARPTGA
jgi:hypothetical protein